MSNEPRKASDVLLDLESKIDVLISIVRTQDLNIKVLSNKLNALMAQLEQKQRQPVIETANVTANAYNQLVNQQSLENKNIIMFDPAKDYVMEVEKTPKSFRRTDRQDSVEHFKKSAQPQIQAAPEIIVQPNLQAVEQQQAIQQQTDNVIPVIQRVVDKNGKSIFLADVEIFDNLNQSVYKTRTNAIGKWMATLAVGAYKVVIRKKEKLTKEDNEAIQHINVENSSSQLELPMVIIK